MANYDTFKIPVIPGINDTSLEPNFNDNGRGCNGSYFIEKFHGLIDEVKRRSIKYEAKSANFVAQPYTVYGIDTGAGAVTATLGPAVGGDVVYFTDATGNFAAAALTIEGAAAQIIGDTSLDLINNYECIAFIYDGANNNWVQWGIESSGNSGGGGGAENYRIINGTSEAGFYTPDSQLDITIGGYPFGKISATSIHIGFNAGQQIGADTFGVGNGTNPVYADTTGAFNTYLGFEAGISTTTGENNVFLGFSPGYYNTSGYDNIFLGTYAGLDNTTGSYNVFLGTDAGGGNTTGSDNIAIGNGSLSTGNPGDNNIAIGRDSMESVTAGTSNISIGYVAMQNATGGDYSIAIGDAALQEITTGQGNIGIGLQATQSVTTGNRNVGLGYNCFRNANEAGSDNIAIGTYSYNSGSSGDGNVFIGLSSALSQNTGSFNTYVGANSGNLVDVYNWTGDNNTLLGNGSLKSTSSASNEITLGNSAITSLRCAVTSITSLSDRRDKTNIQTLPLGLDFITTLNPVKFTWNTRDGAKVGQQAAGFIAQDLQAAQQGNEYLDLVLDNNPDKLEATPGNLIPVLVKAIQELKELVDHQAAEIAFLKQFGN